MAAMRISSLLAILVLALPAAAQGVPDFGTAAAEVGDGVRKTRARDYVGAEAAFDQALEKEPAIAMIYALRGDARARQRKFKEAVADYGKAVELDPKDARWYRSRASARLNLGDAKGAITDLDKALEIAPKETTALALRAQARWSLHEYDTALADYDAAIAANPQNYQAVINRGNARLAVAQFEPAIEDFSTILGINPDYAPAYNGRASAHVALGNTKEALEDLEAAIWVARENPFGYMTRARVHLARGDLDKARADMKQAAELGEKSGTTLFGVGRFQFDLGEAKQAVVTLQHALAAETPAQEYTRLFLCLARMKAGEAAKGAAELKAHLAQREKKDDWFVKVASFLTGSLDEAAFLKAAENENKHLQREQLCEASWYAGAKAWIGGDTARAKPLFEQCVAAKVTQFIEHESSLAALRLIAAANKPAKTDEKKN